MDLINQKRWFEVLAAENKEDLKIVAMKDGSYNFKKYIIKGKGSSEDDSFQSRLNISANNVCSELKKEEKKLNIFLENKSGKNELCKKAILLNQDVDKKLAQIEFKFDKKDELELNKEKLSLYSELNETVSFKYDDFMGTLEKDKQGNFKSFRYSTKRYKGGKLLTIDSEIEFGYKSGKCFPKVVTEKRNNKKVPYPTIEDCKEIEKISSELHNSDSKEEERLEKLYEADVTRLLNNYFAADKIYGEGFKDFFPSNLEKQPQSIDEGIQYFVDERDDKLKRKLETRLSYENVKKDEQYKNITKAQYDKLVKEEWEKHNKLTPDHKRSNIYRMFNSFAINATRSGSICEANYTEKMYKFIQNNESPTSGPRESRRIQIED